MKKDKFIAYAQIITQACVTVENYKLEDVILKPGEDGNLPDAKFFIGTKKVQKLDQEINHVNFLSIRKLREFQKQLLPYHFKQFLDLYWKARWPNNGGSKNWEGGITQEDCDKIHPFSGDDPKVYEGDEAYKECWKSIYTAMKGWNAPVQANPYKKALAQALGHGNPLRKGASSDPNDKKAPGKDLPQEPKPEDNQQETPQEQKPEDEEPPDTGVKPVSPEEPVKISDPEVSEMPISEEEYQRKLHELEVEPFTDAAGAALGWVGRALKGLWNTTKPMYYYVWWVFESYDDYIKISKSHIYPRRRGTGTVNTREIPNKDIAKALSLGVESSDVEGFFLGEMGLKRRDDPWTDTVNLPDPIKKILPSILAASKERKSDPVIALGAARAKRWEWDVKEVRGLTNGGLMNFDIQKLQWYWTAWLGGDADEHDKKGALKVRTVTRKLFDDHKAKPNALEILMDEALTTGIITDAKVGYQSKTAGKISDQPVDEHGFHTFTEVPFNEVIEAFGEADGYKKGKNELPDSIILSVDNDEIDAIIPLDFKDDIDSGLDPAILVRPRIDPDTHNEPISPEFDSTAPHSYAMGSKDAGSTRGAELSFNVYHKKKHPPIPDDQKVFIEVMIMKQEGTVWKPVCYPPETPGRAYIWNKNAGKIKLAISKGATPKAKGKLNRSIDLAPPVTSGDYPRVVTPSFDIPDGVTGDYRIYCLAKKTDWLFSAQDASNTHLAHLTQNHYHDIDKKDRLLWDYNYISFKIGPKDVTSAGSSSASSSPKAKVEQLKAKCEKDMNDAYHEINSGDKPITHRYSSKETRQLAHSAKDLVLKALPVLASISNEGRKDKFLEGIKYLTKFIIAQNFHESYQGKGKYPADINTLKTKKERTTIPYIEFIKKQNPDFFKALEEAGIIKELQAEAGGTSINDLLRLEITPDVDLQKAFNIVSSRNEGEPS